MKAWTARSGFKHAQSAKEYGWREGWNVQTVDGSRLVKFLNYITNWPRVPMMHIHVTRHGSVDFYDVIFYVLP